jgi:TorA maturation chaperone TorD
METVTFEDFTKLARSRSGMYRFLASIFLEKPAAEFVANLKSGDLYKTLSSQVPPEGGLNEFSDGLRDIEGYSRKNKDRPFKELQLELEVEWTRLFRGVSDKSSPPPPYESVYQGGGRLLGEHTVDVMADYAKGMVEVSKDLGEAPDHIGVELEFMGLLCEKESNAWSKRDFKTAIEHLEMEKGFLGKHVSRWLPKLCKEVAGKDGLGIFRGLILIANTLVGWDSKNMEQLTNTALTLAESQRKVK